MTVLTETSLRTVSLVGGGGTGSGNPAEMEVETLQEASEEGLEPLQKGEVWAVGSSEPPVPPLSPIRYITMY